MHAQFRKDKLECHPDQSGLLNKRISVLLILLIAGILVMYIQAHITQVQSSSTETGARSAVSIDCYSL